MYNLGVVGVNDSNFKKFMFWQGIGRNTSPNSYVGQQISAYNEKPRFMSEREIALTIQKRKAFNILYSLPIKDLLEIMARNGKFKGMYLNAKQGWDIFDITKEEIITKHKLDWRPRHEKLNEFAEDIKMIRDYRVYHAAKTEISTENENVIKDMIKNEWTMNAMDGYISIKQLWQKYRSDIIKFKNLEFRLLDDNVSKGTVEIPIVIDEDNIEVLADKQDPTKLRIIENRWMNLEKDTAIPSKKRKLENNKKRKIKTEKIRFGSEEMLKEMSEIKRLLLSLKEKEYELDPELYTLDKIDQIREVERSIYDEETKNKMIQIILSRQERTDLKYKILEEELLSGKNYLIQMPRIERVRTNILGMIAEIDEIDTKKWEDRTLADRLQIITGERIKKVFNHHIQETIRVLVEFRKEIELANELKGMCEDKKGFNLKEFKDMLRSTIESNEYENKRFMFLERWCIEIEDNIEKGMKKKVKKANKTEHDKMVVALPDVKPKKNCTKGRFTITTSEESTEENLPSTSGLSRILKKENESVQTEGKKNESIISISSTDGEKSDIIERENTQFLVYSSSDDESDSEDFMENEKIQYMTYESSEEE